MNTTNYIMSKKLRLESHKLVDILCKCDGSKDALAFAPDMAFFVLGFKDLLQICKVANPKTDDDFTINTHCDEDSHHWLWYLEDIEYLEKLSVKNTLNVRSGTAYARQVWSHDNYKIRLHTYCMASLLLNAETTRERLVIIDCLEAAFSVFITALNHTTQKSNLFETLRYFGKEHYIDEASHDQGSWLDKTRDKNDLDFYDSKLCDVVDVIFDGFQSLFTAWANTLIDIGVDREISTQERLVVDAEPV